MGGVSDDELLQEQLAYYRERAPEYDNWWERTAQYALPPERMDEWQREVADIERWVDSLAPLGATLELAAGTGIWTRRLAGLADRVVALDAAPEVLERNRARPECAAAEVEYVEHDVFSYAPAAGAYDTVFFSFWLSHVPPDRFDSFWAMVRGALRPGGRAVFLDNRLAEREAPPSHVVERTDLSTGNAFRIVKVYFEPDELTAALSRIGWEADVFATGSFFVAGVATPLA